MLYVLESLPYFVLFIFGTVIGSFLNVCIYRLPLGQSVVTAPSHCMSCGEKLRWYDMVPVVSWLVLGGKCRNCKSKISIQYPLIEAVNGLLYVGVCMVTGLNLTGMVYCLMASALLTLSVIDFRTYEIPVEINWFLLILGILATALDHTHLADHLIGCVCVSGLLGLIYILSGGNAIGGGDVKLMAAAGLLLGWQRIILAFLLGCILGSILHLIRIKAFKAGRVLALGPYLSMGILLSALWGNQWLESYLSLLGL